MTELEDYSLVSALPNPSLTNRRRIAWQHPDSPPVFTVSTNKYNIIIIIINPNRKGEFTH